MSECSTDVKANPKLLVWIGYLVCLASFAQYIMSVEIASHSMYFSDVSFLDGWPNTIILLIAFDAGFGVFARRCDRIGLLVAGFGTYLILAWQFKFGVVTLLTYLPYRPPYTWLAAVGIFLGSTIVGYGRFLTRGTEEKTRQGWLVEWLARR